MDTKIFNKIQSSMIGKEIKFVPIGTGIARDWLETTGTVEAINLEYGSIELRIKDTSTHKKYIGTTTNFSVERDWGFVFTQTEWD